MMRNLTFSTIVLCFVLFPQVAFTQETTKGNETPWQNKPGDIKLNWESQVFHLGNGYFGASAYGGAKQEVLTLSEKTFWTGGPGDSTNYNFGIVPVSDPASIKEIKRLTSEGKIGDADQLVAKYLVNDTWYGLGGLSTIGGVMLNFERHEGEVQDYERVLNLNNSTLTIKYKAEGVNYRREYFRSYPDRILAIRITADGPKALTDGDYIIRYNGKTRQVKIKQGETYYVNYSL